MIKKHMGLFEDPDRWVDSDMQRSAWLKRAALLLLLAAIITVVAITIGVVFS